MSRVPWGWTRQGRAPLWQRVAPVLEVLRRGSRGRVMFTPMRGIVAGALLVVLAPMLLAVETSPGWRWAWGVAFGIGVVGGAMHVAWWWQERRR